ncbi:MAG: GyrI-like domain-containing protein [Eudoraea sp.]|nr:GyrI-like domain-containing protein [Eudoraea sp.]
MKHEWRKREKEIYLPGNKPVFIDVPDFGFYTIEGEGNPNSDHFPGYIEALYSVSYAIKMSYKKGLEPEGFFDYAVYPLEGVWDLKEEAKENYSGTLDKNDLVFQLMIRQPDFVDEEFAMRMLEITRQKKHIALLDHIRFQRIPEGKCVQMLHLGSYDDEPQSFQRMEEYATEAGVQRISKKHREIYLTDARKVAPEKLKTVLRFQVGDQIKEG